MKHVYRLFGKYSGLQWIIEGSEVYHACKVLRMKVGDQVEVTDGQGKWSSGHIVSMENHKMMIECEEIFHQISWSHAFHLCIGTPKPQNVDKILPEITELGVQNIYFFASQDTAKFRVTFNQQQRWQRQLISACKQSKSAIVPKVTAFPHMRDLFEHLAPLDAKHVFLDPGSQQSLLKNLLGQARESPLAVWVGTEKGFSQEELDILTNYPAEAANLGNLVLRTTTATLCVAALANQLLQNS